MSPSYEEFLKEHLCTKCSVAVMIPHNDHFIRCPICGYTKEHKKEIKDVHRITGNVSPKKS